MTTPVNKKLYNKIKKEADEIYKKSSAYKSGYIVKRYKQEGGKYINKNNNEKPLKRWFEEKWHDINNRKGYPVYRPTIRINNKTPLLQNEIKPENIKKQINLKQKIKGGKNLPAFIKKN